MIKHFRVSNIKTWNFYLKIYSKNQNFFGIGGLPTTTGTPWMNEKSFCFWASPKPTIINSPLSGTLRFVCNQCSVDFLVYFLFDPHIWFWSPSPVAKFWLRPWLEWVGVPTFEINFIRANNNFLWNLLFIIFSYVLIYGNFRFWIEWISPKWLDLYLSRILFDKFLRLYNQYLIIGMI